MKKFTIKARPETIQDQGRGLIELVHRRPDALDWFKALEQAHTRAIIGAIGELGSTGAIGARLEGYREAARAMVEQKLSDQMIAKMEDLERVSTRLGWIAVFVGLAAIGVAIVQLLVARA